MSRCATPLALLVPVLAMLTAGPRAGADPPVPASFDLRERICHTIFNAIRLARTDAYVDPDAMDLYRKYGQAWTKDADGLTYAYMHERDDTDGEGRMKVSVQVIMLKPAHVPDFAKDWSSNKAGERWHFRFIERNGVAGYDYGMMHEGVVLRMQLRKEATDDIDREGEFHSYVEWWSNFHDEAIRHGLFGRVEVMLNSRSGAPAHVPDVDHIGGMGVVHFLHDHDERVVLPLEVWALSPDLRSDLPYRINIALKADYGQPGISFEHDDGTPLTDGDRDGRPDVSAPTGDARIPIRMVFDRFDLPSGMTGTSWFLDQMAIARFYYDRTDDDEDDDGRDDAMLELRASRAGGWWPVVTRMELTSDNWQAGVDGPTFGPPTSTIPEDGFPETIEGFRSRQGALLHGWQKLRDWACIRPGMGVRTSGCSRFGPADDVPLSWYLDPNDKVTFLTQAHTWDQPLPAIRWGDDLRLVLDIEAVVPTATALALDSPPFGDGFESPFTMKPDPALLPDTLAAARRSLAQSVQLEDIRITLRRVAPHGVLIPDEGDPRRADVQGTLVERIRRRIDGTSDAQHVGPGQREVNLCGSPSEAVALRYSDPTSVPSDVLRLAVMGDLARKGTPLGVLFPVAVEQGEPDSAWEFIDGRLASRPGLFELRLQARTVLFDGTPGSRSIDVAVRYNVVAPK